MAPNIQASGENDYKSAWARFVTRIALEADFEKLKCRISTLDQEKRILVPDLQVRDDTSIRDVAKAVEGVTGSGVVAPVPGKFKVAIVGAGVAGLFTAMLFEWLNEKLPDLEIDYDIIEAADKDRLGGRLYTHYFSEQSEEDKQKGWVNHDYYDVGAMRYPENGVMKRTYELFKLLGMEKLDEKRIARGDKEKLGDLIRYYMKDGEKKGDPGVCPSYFNNIRQVGRIFDSSAQHGVKVDDPYELNKGLPSGSKIPEELLNQDPATLVERALKPFLDRAKAAMDDKARARHNDDLSEETEFWKFLMAADNMSIRQYLSLDHIPKDFREFLQQYDNDGKWKPPAYNYNTIEWLETATYGTGWYDQALSEVVLEELDFATVKPEMWWCISGGTQVVPKRMAQKIKKHVQFNSQVVAINANVEDRKKKRKEYVPLTLSVNTTCPGSKEVVSTRTEKYLAVFNSTTLAAMQRMDLQNAGLSWGTKQAIRALGYGASCKVAIKFKTPWWQLEPYNINMGSLSRTDLPLRVCVYPSYNIEKLEGKERWKQSRNRPSVLLCSYTWGQDAQRIGSLISREQPRDERSPEPGQEPKTDKQLVSLLLRNLALLHATGEGDSTYEKLLERLEGEYITHHAWDWYRDENMSGAFAYFGPSQFSNMWQEIIKPNAFGQLYLVGEAASSHHAWIVGALESVIRATYLLFENLKSGKPHFKPYSQAMELLREGKYRGQDPKTIDKEKMPFWPLPAEMPHHQLHIKTERTDQGDEEVSMSEITVRGATKDAPFSYTEAVAALSLLESFFEFSG